MEHFTSKLKRTKSELPMFAPLYVGAYKLSIQASPIHYCDPRENFDDASEYTTFEVMIVDAPEEGGLHFPTFSGFARAQELAERWEWEKFGGVGGHVPADLIQEWMEYLESLYE